MEAIGRGTSGKRRASFPSSFVSMSKKNMRYEKKGEKTVSSQLINNYF
jgi:hypothetical protein